MDGRRVPALSPSTELRFFGRLGATVRRILRAFRFGLEIFDVLSCPRHPILLRFAFSLRDVRGRQGNVGGLELAKRPVAVFTRLSGDREFIRRAYRKFVQALMFHLKLMDAPQGASLTHNRYRIMGAICGCLARADEPPSDRRRSAGTLRGAPRRPAPAGLRRDARSK